MNALLAAGAGGSVNLQDTDGSVALHFACVKGNIEIAQALLAAGAGESVRWSVCVVHCACLFVYVSVQSAVYTSPNPNLSSLQFVLTSIRNIHNIHNMHRSMYKNAKAALP